MSCYSLKAGVGYSAGWGHLSPWPPCVQSSSSSSHLLVFTLSALVPAAAPSNYIYTEMMLPLWRSSQSGDPGSTNTRAGSPYCGCLHIDRAPRWVPTPPLTCCRSRRMEEILFLPRGRQQSPSPVWRLHSLQASYLLTPAAPLCCPHWVLLLPAGV